MNNDGKLQITLNQEEIELILNLVDETRRLISHSTQTRARMKLFSLKWMLESKVDFARSIKAISENNANDSATNNGYPDY